MPGNRFSDDQSDSLTSRDQFVSGDLLLFYGKYGDGIAFCKNLFFYRLYHCGIYCHSATDSEKLEDFEIGKKNILFFHGLLQLFHDFRFCTELHHFFRERVRFFFTPLSEHTSGVQDQYGIHTEFL